MQVRTFKFDAYGLLLGVTLVFGGAALWVLADFVAGEPDWFRVEGFIKLPKWAEDLIILANASFLTVIFVAPALRDILRGHVLKTEGNRILLGGKFISPSEVVSMRQSLLRGIRVRTVGGVSESIRPGFSKGAWPELAAFARLNPAIELHNIRLEA